MTMHNPPHPGEFIRETYIEPLFLPDNLRQCPLYPPKTCRSNDRIGPIGKGCMDFDIAVCSHNELPMEEAVAGCTRTHVEEERQFIRDLRNAILAEFEKGTGFMEIPKVVRLPQYSHWVGYEEWLEMNTLRVMTDLWMGPFPWVPNARSAVHSAGYKRS